LDEKILADFDAEQAQSVLREPHGWWRVFKVVTRVWQLSLFLLAYIILTVLTGGVLIVAQLLAPVVPEFIRGGMHSLFNHHHWLRAVIDVLLVSRGFTTIYLLIAFGYFIWQLFPHPDPEPYLRPKAAHIREKLGVQYVTMGHTHETDLDNIGDNAEYFNTSTWTKVITDDEQLFREENEMVFLQVIRHGRDVSCKLMRWNDGANEPRLVKLFTDVGVPKSARSAARA